MADKEKGEQISYLFFESVMMRMTQTIKRLWVVIIVILILWFGTIGIYEYRESQYEVIDTEVTYSQDGEGTNVIGTGNEVLYGTEVSRKN